MSRAALRLLTRGHVSVGPAGVLVMAGFVPHAGRTFPTYSPRREGAELVGQVRLPVGGWLGGREVSEISHAELARCGLLSASEGASDHSDQHADEGG